MSQNTKELALKIAGFLNDKKAFDIVVLDIQNLSPLADYFVIASGRSELQVRTMYEELRKHLEKEGIFARHRDGHQGNRWIVLDYGDVIVHLFHHEERGFYKLERLWADGRELVIDNTN